MARAKYVPTVYTDARTRSGKSVKVVDRGYQAMLNRLILLRGATVKVGVYGENASQPHGPATNVEVAAFHEFGTENVPERSFVRATVDAGRTEIGNIQRRIAKGVKFGKIDVRTGLGILGEHVRGMMQKRIRDGIAPPLKPETIQRKGSSTPLIDTGQLLNSIAWQVET